MLGGFSGIMNIIYLEQYWVNIRFFYYIVIFIIIIIKWKFPMEVSLGFCPFYSLHMHAYIHTQTHTNTHSVSHTLNLTEVFTWRPEAKPSLKGVSLTGILLVSRGAVWLSEVS